MGLADFHQVRVRVIAAVAEVEQSLPDEPKSGVELYSFDDLLDLSAQLAEMLRTHNLQALEHFGRLHSTLELHCPSEKVQELAHCLERLDFERATELLNECQPLAHRMESQH